MSHLHHSQDYNHQLLLEGLSQAIAEYHIVEGGSFQIVHQVARLRELIGKCSPKSIMEIGFNAGHSALLFLAITPPETKVVSFDLGEYAYVFVAKRYIDSVFPGRHTLVTGDSTITIPKYEEHVAHWRKNPDTAPPLRFDFIFIDGGNQNDIPMKDIINSQRLIAGANTLVAIDDICRVPERHAHYTIEPTKAWAQMVRSGVISEDGFDDYYEIMKRDNNSTGDCMARGMAWGKYCLMQESCDDPLSYEPGHEDNNSIVNASQRDNSLLLQRNRYNYYQNSCKYMDRNQMLQEIHNQHYYHKEHEKLVAVADMYLEYFPTYNKRDTNYTRFYRASSNFVLNPIAAIKQYEEIIDTPSPPPNAANGVNDNDSEMPDFIKESSVVNLGVLYPKDHCSEIPKIIHLLYFGETEFLNFHHRCIHSMLQYMPEYDVRIYNAKEPIANTYWDDIKNQPRVTIHKLDPPVYFDGFELKHFQYKADVVRLELLYEHGGIYLDIDMIIIRPFHEVFSSGHSFYISEERQASSRSETGALINAFLAAKPKNEFIKLWLNEFKSGLRLGIWAHHIRDSNKQLMNDHPHYIYKYRIKVLNWKLFMPLHWQDTEAFIRSETIPYEFPAESYGTHLWETILGDVMRKNEFLQKQKMDLLVYHQRKTAAAEGADPGEPIDDTELTIYPEYFHDQRSDQYIDKYITNGKNGGYFIEIGAGDGEINSSTLFFEKYRNWHGLAVEPARVYESSLRSNRTLAICAAVSNVTSSMTNGSGSGAIFYESVIRNLSGLKGALESNKYGEEWTRNSFKSYKVDTITLYDLCCQNSAPDYIDYCAIDCQGCEYEVLSTFFEENQLSVSNAEESEGINMIVMNKIFCINFFRVEVSSNKIYEKIRDLMDRNNYEENINPYLSVLPKINGQNVKYFKYNDCSSSSGSGSGSGSGMSSSGTGAYKTGNSPQLSDRSISSISSGVNFTPQTIQTPPSSPEMASSSSTSMSTNDASFLHQCPFAEEVVVICLEERPERTQYVCQHLQSHGVKYSILMNNIHPDDTKIGCFQSHVNAIRYAVAKNLSSVLILEDDVVLRDNIRELASIELPGNDWDILYLGGILTKYDGIDESRKWVKGTIWCNHAYLVKQHMYQTILDFVDSYPNLIDLERRNIDYMYTEYIQPKYKCWLANEQYIVQKEGYSEIDNRVKWGSGFDWSTFSMKVV